MKKGWDIKKIGEVRAIENMRNRYEGIPYVGMEDIESDTSRFLGSVLS